MTYNLTRFDELDLPTSDPEVDVGTGEAHAPIRTLPAGGVFDSLGDQVARRKKTEIQYRTLVRGDTAALLKTAFDNLKGKWGKRGRLYRRHDTAEYEWILARLMEIKADRKVHQVSAIPIRLVFSLVDPVWWGDSHGTPWTFDSGELFDAGKRFDEETEDKVALAPSATTSFAVNNSGNAIVENAVITVTAGDANITALDIRRRIGGTVNEQLLYSGAITAGESLVIDCGAWTVENNGSDDIDNFAFGSLHQTDSMFKLLPGANSIRVDITGGGTGSTILIGFRDGCR